MYRDRNDGEMQGSMRDVDRQNRKRMTEGILNLLGVLFGIGCILILSALLISLVNWLRTDIAEMFLEHSLTF